MEVLAALIACGHDEVVQRGVMEFVNSGMSCELVTKIEKAFFATLRTHGKRSRGSNMEAVLFSIPVSPFLQTESGYCGLSSIHIRERSSCITL